MTAIRCDLPKGSEDWRPDPFPGSEEAVAASCRCPHDQPWPGSLIFDISCPVHELERRTQ